jgi:hypothetical protein
MSLGHVLGGRVDGFASLQAYSHQGNGNRGGEALRRPDLYFAFDSRLQ